MKITLCGSIAFISEMIELQKKLEQNGHTVFIPSFIAHDKEGNPMSAEEFYRIRKEGKMELSWFEVEKEMAILAHFKEIERSDAIFVANYDKNGVPGYIGGNTLMEMALALYLKKPIYLLNPIPEMSYREEIIGMRPIVLSGDLAQVK